LPFLYAIVLASIIISGAEYIFRGAGILRRHRGAAQARS